MPKNFLPLFLLGTFIALSAHEETRAIPNPASQNCIEKGGKLIILKRGDGGQYGVCLLPDGKQCEEWALFRGDCPAEGITLDDSLSAEERYCLITGGIILGNASQCQLPTGKICDLKDLYGGKCER